MLFQRDGAERVLDSHLGLDNYLVRIRDMSYPIQWIIIIMPREDLI